MTYYFYQNLQLINTVNNNYKHICELEELIKLYDNCNNYWTKEVGVEYDILYKISLATYNNHYSDRCKKWDISKILPNLDNLSRTQIEELNIKNILPDEDFIR